MLKGKLLSKFGALMIAVSLLAISPVAVNIAQAAGSATATQPATAWAPAPPAPGMGSLAVINFNGKGFPINLDLNGTTYTVPEEANNVPGRLQIDLAPGTYSYTASSGNLNDVTRTVDIGTGQIISLSFYQTNPGLIRMHHSTSEAHSAHGTNSYYETSDHNELVVAQGDITAQAR
jgi:hypothetical protein